MQELRLVAVSEDGTYVVLAQPGRGTRFSLPNDERLRAVARGQFSRLAQYEIEVENPLRPKEIQARIRAGETAEQIADAAGVPIERVRWFEGPVLAERAYVAQQAQTASVRRPGDSGPGPRLGEIVAERLRLVGTDPDQAQWDSRKQGDGSWVVELTSEIGPERLRAAWIFDSRRRHAIPEDDQAARLSLPEDVLRAAGLSAQPPPPARGLGTVTPFVPRSSAAARAGTPDPPPIPPPFPPAGHEQPAGPAAAVPPAAAAEQIRSAAHGSGQETDGEPAEVTLRPARLAGPHPSPSGLPHLQPPAPDTHTATARAQPQAPRTQQEPAAPALAPELAQPSGQAAEPGAGEAAAAAEAKEPPVANKEPPVRTRSGRKAAGGRARRSSVPTWDEIMFGSSRPQE